MPDEIDKLFTIERTIGPDWTLEAPCGLWCAVIDWVRWRTKMTEIQKHIALALTDLEKTGSREVAPLRARFEQWEKALADEPLYMADLQESPYSQNIKLGVDRLVELGKIARNLLRDIVAATRTAGGVSLTPGSTPVPGKGGFSLRDVPWWAWGIAGYFAWKYTSGGDEPS